MKSTTILLAEDHTIVREGLKALLKLESDFEVVGEAENGRQAVAMTAELRPDVIVMDLVMPKFNGLEATEKILEKYPDIHIIACSSLDDETTINQASEKGCLAFLRKPFNKSSVKSVFQQLEYSKRGQKHA